ncbi:MAG: hypothetical protein CMO55_16900 [Verrucomicrobiales bacterium]|nr:hypothetical protein [Verrucomicrobiales bacterium]
MGNRQTEKVALTPGEFAALFGKSQTWGYRQLYAGKVTALTGYGRTLIPVSEVERVLREAGRYNGAGCDTEKMLNPRVPKPTPSINPWRESVRNRRNGTTASDSRKAKRSAAHLQSQRSSALRKLNRRK